MNASKVSRVGEVIVYALQNASTILNLHVGVYKCLFYKIYSDPKQFLAQFLVHKDECYHCTNILLNIQ